MLLISRIQPCVSSGQYIINSSVGFVTKKDKDTVVVNPTITFYFKYFTVVNIHDFYEKIKKKKRNRTSFYNFCV